MVTELIDDVFVLEERHSSKSFLFEVTGGKAMGNNSATDEKGRLIQGIQMGLEKGGLISQLIGGITGKKEVVTSKIDQARRELQAQQKVVFDEQLHHNTVVSKFLFEGKLTD